MPYSIMLDAGHGGRDPGAVYNGRQEKIDTLSLTLAIGQILQERGNQTNIIVCSSRNMKLPGVYGCIWYSEISDWEEELCDLVREMEKSK